MKEPFYKIEMDMLDFVIHPHTFQEWLDYGFNKLEYLGRSYWDGKEEGQYEVNKDYLSKKLEYDYYDYDQDGYMFVVLTEVKED